jgi:Ca2+-binding EF-hand superfamily protein
MEKEELVLNSSQLRLLRTQMDDFIRRGDNSKLKAIFSMFDRNKNGRIDCTELRSVMEQLTQSRFTDEDIRQMMDEADANGNGYLEYTEFSEIMIRYRRSQ